jgi:hypothetical protein
MPLLGCLLRRRFKSPRLALACSTSTLPARRPASACPGEFSASPGSSGACQLCRFLYLWPGRLDVGPGRLTRLGIPAAASPQQPGLAWEQQRCYAVLAWKDSILRARPCKRQWLYQVPRVLPCTGCSPSGLFGVRAPTASSLVSHKGRLCGLLHSLQHLHRHAGAASLVPGSAQH